MKVYMVVFYFFSRIKVVEVLVGFCIGEMIIIFD